MTKMFNKNVKPKLIALFILVLATGSLIHFDVFATDNKEYSVNKNGQTFGTIADVGPDSQPPELIAATGLDDKIGYVYYEDLQGDQPHNPKEAIEYMERLNVMIKEAREKGESYLWYIPLYESDGMTVIGSYGIVN